MRRFCHSIEHFSAIMAIVLSVWQESEDPNLVPDQHT